MPKEVDKGKHKRPSQSRRKRIQLDDGSSVAGHSRSSARLSSANTGNASTSNPEPPQSVSSRPSTSIIPESDKNESTNQNRSPTGSGASSPEPNCAICLSKLENKSFTDSCFHMFCFVCLREWSKVKAECPLCKQTFKSIVHNVRSYDDYDQYQLPRPEDRRPNPVDFPDFLSMPGMPGVRFRYRTTVTDHRYADFASRLQQELENHMLQRPSAHMPVPNWRRLRQPANSEFRRSIYLQRLQIRSEQMNTRRRVRETSPSFYQENPAQTHRLVPWLNRELNALLQGDGQQVAFVLDFIVGLIKRHAIDSEEFYHHMYPYTGRNTRHFMREFLAFARSPYHMAAYDRHTAYEPSNDPHIDSDSESDHQRVASDDGNDSDVVVISPREPQLPPGLGRLTSDLTPVVQGQPFPSFAPMVRSTGQEDLSTAAFGHRQDLFAPPSASGWDSPTPGPSSMLYPMLGLSGSLWAPSPPRSYSNPPADPLPSRTRTRNLVQLSHPEPSNNTGITGRVESSDSDVEIVEVEKPWTERSPIQLSSAAESDYDVMITGTGHIYDEMKTEHKKKKHKKHKHKEQRKQKRRRSTDSSTSQASKKRRHSARDSSLLASAGPSRSRSRSPIRISIYKPSDCLRRSPYDTHSPARDSPIMPRPYRGFYRNRLSPERSRSSSSDTDHQVSIMSHKHKSKSRHSSIEIVKYRKKSSKHKKNKKHRIETDSTSLRHRHKSKKKKHKRDKTKHKSSEKELVVTDKAKPHGSSAMIAIYTSDSETDSYGSDVTDPYFEENENKTSSDLVTSKQQGTSKRTGNTAVAGPTTSAARQLGASGPSVAVEEISAAQAAVLDEELDSINKALSGNDYIGSLFSTAVVTKQPWHDNNNPPAHSQPPAGLVNMGNRGFKKHPFGHKKSRKPALSTSTTTTSTGAAQAEDTIQSNDITSCSELDTDRQLPSFHTFVGRNEENGRNAFNQNPAIPKSIFAENQCPGSISKSTKSCMYDSPTSTQATVLQSGNKRRPSESCIVDVETMSDSTGSEIDVTEYQDTNLNRATTPSMSRPKTNTDNLIHQESLSRMGPGSHQGDHDQRTSTQSSTAISDSCYNSSGIPPYRTSADSLKLTGSNRIEDKESDSGMIQSRVGISRAHYSSHEIPEFKTSKHSIKFPDNNNIELKTIKTCDGLNKEDIDTYQVNRQQDLSSDKDIDVVGDHDSDIECSLVEGHKTFEIADDSDSDTILGSSEVLQRKPVDVQTDEPKEIDIVNLEESKSEDDGFNTSTETDEESGNKKSSEVILDNSLDNNTTSGLNNVLQSDDHTKGIVSEGSSSDASTDVRNTESDTDSCERNVETSVNPSTEPDHCHKPGRLAVSNNDVDQQNHTSDNSTAPSTSTLRWTENQGYETPYHSASRYRFVDGQQPPLSIEPSFSNSDSHFINRTSYPHSRSSERNLYAPSPDEDVPSDASHGSWSPQSPNWLPEGISPTYPESPSPRGFQPES